MQQGGDGELCLTIPISTRVMCCGSLLGVQDVIALNILFIYCFIYFFYRHSQELQAFPAGALLSSSLHMAFLLYLAFFFNIPAGFLRPFCVQGWCPNYPPKVWDITCWFLNYLELPFLSLGTFLLSAQWEMFQGYWKEQHSALTWNWS